MIVLYYIVVLILLFYIVSKDLKDNKVSSIAACLFIFSVQFISIFISKTKVLFLFSCLFTIIEFILFLFICVKYKGVKNTTSKKTASLDKLFAAHTCLLIFNAVTSFGFSFWLLIPLILFGIYVFISDNQKIPGVGVLSVIDIYYITYIFIVTEGRLFS